jgi:hypothetical protein
LEAERVMESLQYVAKMESDNQDRERRAAGKMIIPFCKYGRELSN